jgi:hypothetical protein
MSKPVVLDLFCGLGGWSKGFLGEGWEAIGFDIERHEYGENRYSGELILHDVLGLNGYDLAAVNPWAIVASPPCQEFSYMAMPFSRGKRIVMALRGQGEFPMGYMGSRTVEDLCRLFRACFRIQRELSDALGRQVPMVVENVVGAQAWVGRAKWHFGSYYLWGDVPALMPITLQAVNTVGHVNIRNGHTHTRHLTNQAESDGVKHGRDCFSDPNWPGKQGSVKQRGSGPEWFDTGITKHGSRSSARKAASAMIAEIPFDLASHIARVFKP